ncbi:glycosyltransferase [Butyrivibrio sp. DSM 10294]|uniref:glycosyltransferase family protein n=1 Tax=Butyrivibrio sp. DSM 10294 TaxID=2972457 RepID=UPI00234F4354|nr:glycosyltransferase [Butyrivibrio sp. DSM 10294]MDC7293605.1 glycosyltransferase [Butyrivibrio sp. DSM 10294]
MFGRIVLFKMGESCYDSINAMVVNLKKEFELLGIICDEIDVSQAPEQVLKYMEVITSRKYDAAIAFNAVGQQDISLAGKNIYDLYEIPFINILLDHPMDHYASLKSTCNNYHIVCVDRNHVAFLKRYFPKLAGAYFLPLAAAYDDSCEPKEISERSQDIIFAGTLIGKSCQTMIEEFKQYPEPYNNIILYVIDRMLSYRNEDISAAYDYVIHEELKLELPDTEYLDIMFKIQLANHFMRTFQREEILGSILKSNIPIHLYGDGMQRLFDGCPNNKAIYHGTVPFSKMPEIYSDAKIVLNIMPLFKNGCHDRIPFTMLQGAAVLTDPSEYISDTLGNYVFTYSYDDDFAEKIHDILKDEYLLSLTAKRGREYALANFTWKQYAKKILDIVEQRGITDI